MTNQEFANLFAMAQSIPGPNMILMMSFVGWKVWGFPGAVASAFATFGPPCTMYFAAPGNAARARSCGARPASTKSSPIRLRWPSGMAPAQP
jgi:chromate transporter